MKGFMRIFAIAGNTFRENIRDKILYNLILFALLMIVSSFLLGQLTLGLENKVIIDLGLTSISVFGTLGSGMRILEKVSDGCSNFDAASR